MRKILILTLFIFLFGGYIVAQPTSKGFLQKDLGNISRRSARAAIFCIRLDKDWITNVNARNNFTAHLDSIGMSNDIVKQKAIVDSIYSVLGDNYMFLEGDYSDYPTILQYKAGRVLILHALRGSSIYNEARLNEYEMATKAVSDIALPIAHKIADYIPNDIQYVGIVVAYPYRDLTEKYLTINSGGCIILAIPTSTLKDYAHTYITENDLLNQSDLYGYNQDHPFRRIEIKINQR